MKLKIGDKVKTEVDHAYLSITKRQVGIVTDIYQKTSITVKFKKRAVIFCLEELKKVE